MSFRSRVKRALISDQGNRPTTFVYGLTVGAIVKYYSLTARYAFRKADPVSSGFNENVTFAVKTFLRPRTMNRCLAGIRQTTFTGQVVVADDSDKYWSTADPAVQVVKLPFNVGISRGRNAALEQVKTKYVLFTDDDTVHTRASNWQKAYEYLEAHPDVDAVACTLIEVPSFRTHVYGSKAETLYAKSADPVYEPGQLVHGLPFRLMTSNDFLARTESIRSIGGWDDELRLNEHRDFFSRASGKLVFVQDPEVFAFHARTPWNKKYQKYRHDHSVSRSLIVKKWGE